MAHSAEQTSSHLLQRVSSELKRLADSVGTAPGIDLGANKAADGINQGCNGICGGLAELGRASEIEVSRAATAAAIYHVRLYKEIGSLGANAAEGINQSCNGICDRQVAPGDLVTNPASRG